MSAIDHRFDTAALPQGDPGAARTAGAASGGLGVSWLDRLSLTGKLRLAVFGNTFVLALIALVMLAGTWYLGAKGQEQAIITSVEVRSNNAAIALVDVVDDLAAARGGDAAALVRARSDLALVHDTLSDPVEFAGDAMPADLAPVLDRFLDRTEALRAKMPANIADSQVIAGLEREAQALYRDVSRFAVGIHAEAAASGDRLFAAIGNFLLAFLACVVIGIVGSLAVSRVVIANVAGMIARITAAMKRIAGGENDADIPGGERADEIGEMARSLEVFRAGLLDLKDLTEARAQDVEREIDQQRRLAAEASALRREKSEMLAGLADGFEVTVGEVIASVSAASQQLRTTSQDMASLAEGSAQEARGASGRMDEASANVTAAAAATDEFALSINEVSRQAAASAGLAREASELVASANTKMADLSNAAEEIGEIAGLIQTIAQRTNLLALNASIEAARGGEAGRGFAVVASEVKELATQTSQATAHVAQKIGAIQESSRSSASDLAAIVDQIAALEQASVVIAGAVDQQSASGEDLARNIDTAASGAAEVAQRLAALLKASSETGETARDVFGSAQSLGRLADEMGEKAATFLADVRRSSVELAAEDGPADGGQPTKASTITTTSMA